jgi:hypothetical protein
MDYGGEFYYDDMDDEDAFYDYPFDEGEMTPEMEDILEAYRQGRQHTLVQKKKQTNAHTHYLPQ